VSLVVQTADLVKHYPHFRQPPTRALDGVSVSVEPGTIFGMLGPNGAGKSTFVKILLGIVHPTSGKAALLDLPAGTPRARRRVGYLPESMRLPEWMKPLAFLQFMGGLSGLDAGTARRRAGELLELVGLGGEKKVLKDFSKGMGQRIGLAQALLHDPEVLFLDEPTEGLDPIGRKDVCNLLLELRKRGKTIFLNSHVLSEVERICDRVMIVHQGKILKAGSMADLSSNRNEYRIVLARDGEDVRDAFSVELDARWEPAANGATAVVVRVAAANESPAAGRARLNQIIDRLREIHVEIESVAPQRDSLEETFFQLVGEAGK